MMWLFHVWEWCSGNLLCSSVKALKKHLNAAENDMKDMKLSIQLLEEIVIQVSERMLLVIVDIFCLH